MALTNAQLKAKLAEVEAERDAALEAAANARQRPRWPAGVWPNQNRRNERDPAWRATHRTVIPPNFEAGDVLYLDLSLWLYDPETSPVQYEKNPPKFSASLSPTDPDFAAQKERDYQKALAARGRV